MFKPAVSDVAVFLSNSRSGLAVLAEGAYSLMFLLSHRNRYQASPRTVVAPALLGFGQDGWSFANGQHPG